MCIQVDAAISGPRFDGARVKLNVGIFAGIILRRVNSDERRRLNKLLHGHWMDTTSLLLIVHFRSNSPLCYITYMVSLAAIYEVARWHAVRTGSRERATRTSWPEWLWGEKEHCVYK